MACLHRQLTRPCCNAGTRQQVSAKLPHLHSPKWANLGKLSAAVTAISEDAYQAVDNGLGDGLLELCAHMGDICGDMRRNHLQVLLAWVTPLRDLSNPSP